MEVNVVVVIGFNMVGTKQHEMLRAIRTIHGQSLKITNSGDNQFGCNSRTTTKGH